MRALIIILICAAFLQSTYLPINLVLMILVVRSFITDAKSNFYLAFIFGIVVALLQSQIIGLISIINLGIVALSSVLRGSRLAANLVTAFLVGLILLFLDNVALSLINRSSINFQLVIYQAVIIMPIYALIRYLEEKIITRDEIKLRIKN